MVTKPTYEELEQRVFDLEQRFTTSEEDRSLQREILSNLTEGVSLVRSDDGSIVYTNPRFEQMFGYDPGEMVGKHISTVNAPTEKAPEETAREIMAELEKARAWRGEVSNVRKDGTTFWCSANVSVFDHSIYGKVLVSVHTNIEERKEAEKQLAEGEKRYRHIINSVQVGIGQSRMKDGTVLFANARLAEMFGYESAEELMATGYSPDLYVEPEARSRFAHDLLEQGRVEDYEVHLRRKDGSTLWARMTSAYDEETDLIEGFVEDISLQHQAEEALRESEERYRSLFNNALVGIGRVHVDENRILMANPCMAEMFGYANPAEMIRECDVLSHYADPTEWEGIIRELRERGRVERLEQRLEQTDGTPFRVRVSAVYNEKRGYTEVVYEDITAENKALEMAEFRARLLRTVIDSMPDSITLKDTDGRFMLCNEAAARRTGLQDPSEIKGLTDADFVTGERLRTVMAEDANLLQTGIPVINRENVVTTKDGGRIHVLSTKVVVPGLQGKAVGLLAIHRDITELRKAEESERKMESLLRALFESTSDAIALKDRDLRYTHVNVAFGRFWNLEPSRFVGKTTQEVFGPTGAATDETDRRVLGGESEGREILLNLPGGMRHANVMRSPVKTAEGGVVGTCVIIRDVTGQRQAEQGLRESEKRLRSLVESAEDAIALRDKNLRFTHVNTAFLRLYGGEADVYVSKSIDEICQIGSVTPAHIDRRARMLGGESLRDEVDIQVAGERRQFHVVISPVRSVGGEVEGVCIFMRDITDIRKAEAAIREREAQLRALIDNLPLHVWMSNAEGTCIIQNIASRKQWGDLVGIQVGQAATMPVEIRELMAMQHQQAMAGEVVKDQTEFIADGVFQAQSVVIAPVLVEGEILGTVGASLDTTEQREAEGLIGETFAKLEKSQRNHEIVLNEMQVGILMADSAGHVTFIGRMFEDILGLQREKILGRLWTEILPLPPEHLVALREMVERPVEEGNRMTVRLNPDVGHAYWMEADVRDDPRNPQSHILFFYDVTQVHELREQLTGKAQFRDLIGKSPQMRKVYELIGQVSEFDYTVLILGATGTGKELVAKAVHYASDRRDKPFVVLDCAGFDGSLLSSQMFGHRKGAFTGSIEDRKGVFEAANGGTLFLDEIGEIPLPLQAHLLRVLEEREITRVGESKPRPVDVRVVAATHRDLDAMVAEGQFRQDLLYRIRVARITLPSLRERREDIPLLASWFCRQASASSGRPIKGIGNGAMRLLQEYHWPGNVRELRNAIEFAVTHCHGHVLRVQDLPPELPPSGALVRNLPPTEEPIAEPSLRDISDEVERIEAALTQANGNRKEAARLLGISRATFYRHLARLGLGKSRANGHDPG